MFYDMALIVEEQVSAVQQLKVWAENENVGLSVEIYKYFSMLSIILTCLFISNKWSYCSASFLFISFIYLFVHLFIVYLFVYCLVFSMIFSVFTFLHL